VERQRADTLTRCKRELLWRLARPCQALFTHTALGVSSTVGRNGAQCGLVTHRCTQLVVLQQWASREGHNALIGEVAGRFG
jgi:hypothetical protein